jgi:5-methyltetrahydrofolate--homocysteine methyltransferase
MYARGEIDVSDVVLAAFAMKSSLPILEAEMERAGHVVDYLGTIVIGTVQGDIHDIGSTMVSMLLKARGFRVIDLGVDVSTIKFVDAVRSYQPQILAMSTLMTTTTHELFGVINTLVDEGLREQVKVMVGGSALTRQLSEKMGADGYEPSAHRAAELAWRLTRSNPSLN